MKKITALLLCFLLLCICSATAFAAEPETEETNTEISAVVPDTHKITVLADHAKVFYAGVSDEAFTVGRLSTPRLLIRAESGKVIRSVMVNDVDVTESLCGGYIELAPVYEDQTIVVTAEDAYVQSEVHYTVKGKVTLNGQPLTNVNLELRPALMNVRTDKNGTFAFDGVVQGEHSLTALKDGKVIGYLTFTLQKDRKTDIVLLDDGSYTVSVEENGAGVELNLVLDENRGTLTPKDVGTVHKPAKPQAADNAHLYFLWFLLILCILCIVILGKRRRKKKTK